MRLLYLGMNEGLCFSVPDNDDILNNSSDDILNNSNSQDTENYLFCEKLECEFQEVMFGQLKI